MFIEMKEEGDVTYSKHASFIPRKVKRQPIQLNLNDFSVMAFLNSENIPKVNT